MIAIRRPQQRQVLLGTLLAVTAGCAALPWAGGEPQPVMREEEGVVAWVWNRPGDPERPAMAAIVEGVVAVDESGCVLLRESDDGDMLPVVWPAGTEVASADPVTLVFADGTEVTAGDSVTSGGGYLPAKNLFGHVEDRPCIASGGDVAVLNPRESDRRQ